MLFLFVTSGRVNMFDAPTAANIFKRIKHLLPKRYLGNELWGLGNYLRLFK